MSQFNIIASTDESTVVSEYQPQLTRSDAYQSEAALEAMAVGVPCVSTRCPMGPEELIVDGENGVLVSVGSSQEIAEALNKIIENPDFADKISKNAREILYTHNISAVTDEWINYAQSVIERE